MPGRLISFEGGEGAGKSTVIGAVEARLRARGLPVLRVREPGGTRVGEAVRGVLLDPDLRGMAPDAELLLMFAARAQLLEEIVRPALARGDFVLADRFTDASFAYQGGGRGIDSGWIAELERRVVGLKPDLTLLLDVDVATGLARARGRGTGSDRIEAESRAFFSRVRDAYRAAAQRDPARWRVLDAGQAVEQVTAAALAAVDAWLEVQR